MLLNILLNNNKKDELKILKKKKINKEKRLTKNAK
jgi:hypothetical protein